MTKEKVQMFVVQNQGNFEAMQIPIITQQLERMDDSQMMVLAGADYKNPTTALILSLLLGGIGVDRFYIGDVGLGVLKLLTLGVFGIMTIIDWFIIMKKTREKNYEKFMQIASITPQAYNAQAAQYPPQQAYQQPQYQPQQDAYQQPQYQPQQDAYQQPQYPPQQDAYQDNNYQPPQNF